jgi:hypothetical protein
VLSARNKPFRQQASRRDGLKPVEYALKNGISAKVEESYSNRLARVTAQLRLEGRRFLPYSPPLSESEGQKLEGYSRILQARTEARKKQLEEEELRNSKWEVVEKIEDIDPRIYKFFKIMGPMVTIEEENNDTVIKWNPIKQIKLYRRLGDPIASLYIPWSFYKKVLRKHPYIITERPAEYLSLVKKGAKVFNEYRNSLFYQNWKYTLYEWFWIVAYAKSEGIGKALSMLKVLEDKTEGKISRIHIKKMLEHVTRFWEEFQKYCPCLFKFRKLILVCIGDDPELKEKYEKLREQSRREDEDYVKEIRGKHLDDMIKQLTASQITDKHRMKINIDDRAIKTRPERIRIHHSNPHYQRELEEYRKGLRKEKPRKKKSCGPFDPSILPVEVRARLHNENIVPLW